jgi:hypothetical protein
MVTKYYDSQKFRFEGNDVYIPSEEFVEKALSLTEREYIKMEQKEIPENNENVNLFDLFEMVQLARSGKTAFSYDVPDNVYFEGNEIKIEIEFYVWPSSMDLSYSLTGPSNVEIGPAENVSLQKSGNLIFPLQRYVKSPYPGTLGEYDWETPCFNRKGEIEEYTGSILMDKGYVILEKGVFGVMRAEISAQGYLHKATFTFQKTEAKEIEGIFTRQKMKSITNVESSILATFIRKDGVEDTAKLKLILPKYLLDMLEACPDGTLKREGPCDPSGKPKSVLTKIYYSICTGEVLKIIQKEISNPCDS